MTEERPSRIGQIRCEHGTSYDERCTRCVETWHANSREGIEGQPPTALFCEVLRWAFADLSGSAACMKRTSAGTDQSLAFLTDATGDWAESRTAICEAAGLHPDAVREVALRRFPGPVAARAEAIRLRQQIAKDVAEDETAPDIPAVSEPLLPADEQSWWQTPAAKRWAKVATQ